MLDKLKAIEEKYEELGRLLSDPAVIADQQEFQKHAKAHAGLTEIVETFRHYKKVQADLQDAKEMLQEESLEPDFKEMLEMEIEELTEQEENLTEKLTILLLPKDP